MVMDEFSAIRRFLKPLAETYKKGGIGFMDDAYAIRLGETLVFIKIDGTSIKSSMYPWMGYDDLIYRVAAGAIVDVIAKGGRPTVITASIGLPADELPKSLDPLSNGLSRLIERYGLIYGGGDLNSSIGDGWIDIGVLGYGDKFIPNKPLRPGDKIFITGCLGLSAIPALIHYKGLEDKYINRVKGRVVNPHIPVEFLSVKNKVRASTDISDGLESLRKALNLSGVALKISEEPPLCKEAVEFAEMYSLTVSDILGYLGEEFVIAYVSEEGRHYLGEIVEGPSGQILYKDKVLRGGWDNFLGFMK